MNENRGLLALVFTGGSALLLLGGTIYLLAMRIPVPEFMIGFDGVVMTAVFGQGIFFLQAQAQARTATTLANMTGMHHELAMNVVKTVPQITSSIGEPHIGVQQS